MEVGGFKDEVRDERVLGEVEVVRGATEDVLVVVVEVSL